MGNGSIESADWRELVSASMVSAEQLPDLPPAAREDIRKVIRRYPMRINPYYWELIRKAGNPCWRQAVPDIRELDDNRGMEDPFAEEEQSRAPGVIHRYPDRVVMIVSNRCALYCRHCMRKRKVGSDRPIRGEMIQAGLDYVAATRTIREVILSGGDPLMLPDDELDGILKKLRATRHIDIIRIHTRMPCVLPQRITSHLLEMLRRYHPLYIITQFNHPDEITELSAGACGRLAEAGIPLGCQSVLLKGVNDEVGIMRELMRGLVRIRVKPYYLHHPDPVRGALHFRLPLAKGLEIMQALRGHVSGLCVPHYMIDLPGGGGKTPILPEYARQEAPGRWSVRNFQGRCFPYEE
ncbi:MAG: KamA family radical SAM protein [Thermodesulfobacteriota bacterium]